MNRRTRREKLFGSLGMMPGRFEDYQWTAISSLEITSQPPAVQPTPELPTVQQPVAAPAPQPPVPVPWKFGQLFKPELMNTNHKEWARQYAAACDASPEWHEAQAKMLAEQAERRRKHEARLVGRRQRRKGMEIPK